MCMPTETALALNIQIFVLAPTYFPGEKDSQQKVRVWSSKKIIRWKAKVMETSRLKSRISSSKSMSSTWFVLLGKSWLHSLRLILPLINCQNRSQGSKNSMRVYRNYYSLYQSLIRRRRETSWSLNQKSVKRGTQARLSTSRLISMTLQVAASLRTMQTS